jgi:hypothetical protein
VSRDPIKYEAGDVNIYRYVFNSPAVFYDTCGLYISPTWDWDWKIFWPPSSPSSKACCNGVEYDPTIQCCENEQVVSKESIWICNRHFPRFRWISAIGTSREWQLNHSYVCCDGKNKNCFGKQNYTKKTSPIPNEPHNVQGVCDEKKVCPALKQSKCGTPDGTPPISQHNYCVLNRNCHHWAWEGIE